MPPQPRDIVNIPVVNIQGFQTVAQVAGEIPTETTYQAIDQLTYIHGRHTIKTGFEFRPMQTNDYIFPQFGTYGFTNAYSGYGYADFILGLPQSTQRTLPRTGQSTRYYSLSTFVQDDFKVSQRLTLNYGLRWGYDHPAVDKYDTVFNFNPKTGALVVPTEKVLANNINPAFPKAIPIITAATAGFPERGFEKSGS